MLDRPGRARLGLLVLAALAAASLPLALLVRSLLPAVVVAWGLAATIFAAALFFSYRWDTIVPGDWGSRRLYDYVAFVPALIVPSLLQALAGPLLRGRRAASAVLALAALAVGAAVDRLPRDRSLERAQAGITVAERVADAVPCDARMLANAQTAGTWAALTGRRAVSEGHAPFLRPEVLKRVLPVILEANEFFRDPGASRDFLVRRRIEYVVVVDPDVRIGTVGGRARSDADADADAVASVPGVHPVVRHPLVSVFAGGLGGRCRL